MKKRLMFIIMSFILCSIACTLYLSSMTRPFVLITKIPYIYTALSPTGDSMTCNINSRSYLLCFGSNELHELFDHEIGDDSLWHYSTDGTKVCCIAIGPRFLSVTIFESSAGRVVKQCSIPIDGILHDYCLINSTLYCLLGNNVYVYDLRSDVGSIAFHFAKRNSTEGHIIPIICPDGRCKQLLVELHYANDNLLYILNPEATQLLQTINGLTHVSHPVDMTYCIYSWINMANQSQTYKVVHHDIHHQDAHQCLLKKLVDGASNLAEYVFIHDCHLALYFENHRKVTAQANYPYLKYSNNDSRYLVAGNIAIYQLDADKACGWIEGTYQRAKHITGSRMALGDIHGNTYIVEINK